MKPNSNRLPARQHGAVLFVALIFLLLITLLTLTAIGTSILQEKMTGGMRNRQLSMMGAESALRGTEAWLWSLSFSGTQPLPPCIASTVGTCVHRPSVDGTLPLDVQKFRTSKTWEAALSGTPNYPGTLTGLSGDSETASLATQPVVLVEDLGPNVPPGAGSQSGVIDDERKGGAGTAWFYRITARSQGGTAAVLSANESVFSTVNLTNTGIEP
jgi:type IV pilus assembly protein PilX